MKRWIAVLWLAGVAGMVGAELSVDQIVQKANDAAYYAAKDGRASVRMAIADSSGQTRIRDFTILRMTTREKDQKFYVYFEAPADVRKMAYLVWKHVKKDDDRWLWLPAKNLVKRIAPGDKRTAFVGSDFVYEDVSGRNLDADTHELLETTDSYYKIRNVPKEKGGVEFSEYTVWIDRKTFLPKKAEYLSKEGKPYRVVEATAIREIQGYPTVVESVARDLKRGSSTTNTFSKVEYDLGLSERIFTERFLRRPPREISR